MTLTQVVSGCSLLQFDSCECTNSSVAWAFIRKGVPRDVAIRGPARIDEGPPDGCVFLRDELAWNLTEIRVAVVCIAIGKSQLHLNLLEPFDLAGLGQNSASYIHLVVEGEAEITLLKPITSHSG